MCNHYGMWGRALIFTTFLCFLWTSVEGQVSAQIQEVQQNLVELGYDPGPIDGKLGEKTKDAIRAYQKDNDMDVDGKYSTPLAIKLNVDAATAKHEKTPEGKAEKKERERLLALSNEELTELLSKADKKEANRIASLIGERIKELPISLLWNWMDIGVAGDAMISFALESLYYPGGTEGISQFQRDLGVKVTGDLTYGQFEELARRKIRFYDTPVYVGDFGKLDIFELEGYARVEGTWIIQGEQIAYPINRSTIICRRKVGECEIIQAQLVVPSLKESDDNYLLNLDTDYYTIITWNKDEIVAEDRGDCRTALLTLNKNSNEVYELLRNNKTERCLTGMVLPELDKPRISRLLPGWDLTYNYWQARKKFTGEYANSRLRNKFKTMMEVLKK